MSDSGLVVYACENDLGYCRLGLSVSRKVGNAVRRNRLRRICREAFRLTKHELPGGLDLVLIPKGTEELELDRLKESLPRLVKLLAGRLNPKTGLA
jgi:ribonuclease P protein component